MPRPVTTPSAPSPSCSQLASSPSSANEPGIEQQRDPLADRAACPARRPSRGGARGRRRARERLARLERHRRGRSRSSLVLRSGEGRRVGAAVGAAGPDVRSAAALRAPCSPIASPAAPITSRNSGQPTSEPRPATGHPASDANAAQHARRRCTPAPARGRRPRTRSARTRRAGSTASSRTAPACECRKNRAVGNSRAPLTTSSVDARYVTASSEGRRARRH